MLKLKTPAATATKIPERIGPWPTLYKIKCRAQIAERKKEDLKPIVKHGLIRGWTKRLDGEMNDDILLGSP
jgi:hypothetical protein